MKNENKQNTNHTITLSNFLNQMSGDDWTFQELRFFFFYLSKVNPLDPATSTVSFTIQEFSEAFGVDYSHNTRYLIQKLLMLIHRPVIIPASTGISIINIFSKINVNVDVINNSDNNNETSIISVKNFLEKERTYSAYLAQKIAFHAHEDIKPHIFNLRNNYTKADFIALSNLSSFYQIRMYMLLKQWENLGRWQVEIEEIRKLLGIKKNEYEEFREFKRNVLDTCKEAIEKSEHIGFTFDYSYIRRGRGGKVVSIIFDIKPKKIENQSPKTRKSKANELKELNGVRGEWLPAKPERHTLIEMREIVNNEFESKQCKSWYTQIYNLVEDYSEKAYKERNSQYRIEVTAVMAYFKNCYKAMKEQERKGEITYKGAYLTKIINEKIAELWETSKKRPTAKKRTQMLSNALGNDIKPTKKTKSKPPEPVDELTKLSFANLIKTQAKKTAYKPTFEEFKDEDFIAFNQAMKAIGKTELTKEEWITIAKNQRQVMASE